jgi:hypothetical protein
MRSEIISKDQTMDYLKKKIENLENDLISLKNEKIGLANELKHHNDRSNGNVKSDDGGSTSKQEPNDP